MRTVTVLTAAALAFGGVSGAAAAPERPAPVLRLGDRDPVVLAGLGFQPRERVQVTARSANSVQLRIARATQTGGFVARFTISAPDPCSFSASAIGSRGSRSTLKLPQRMCPPPLDRP